jgi:hypothetical protein
MTVSDQNYIHEEAKNSLNLTDYLLYFTSTLISNDIKIKIHISVVLLIVL